MTIAFVFPGQGPRGLAEYLAFARELPEGAGLLNSALKDEGLSLEAVMAPSASLLERTRIQQPLLVAAGLLVQSALEAKGVVADVRFGHSLGTLSAVAAAGIIAPETAIELARLRGRLMTATAMAEPGGLAALPSRAEAEAAMRDGRLELAAHNSAQEWVVVGPTEALPATAKRIPVEGPWHSRAMAPVVEPLRQAYQSAPRSPGRAQVVLNDATASGSNETRAKTVSAALVVLGSLADEVAQPVYFVAQALEAVRQGVDTFIIVGPGAVLRALLRRNLGAGVTVLTTEGHRDLQRTITKVTA